jgi:hypothetical protein
MNSWDSMDSWSNYSNRPPTTLEDVIYQHLQYWRQHEPPHKLIERFRQLFLEVQHYPDSAVASALIKLMQRPNADRELKYVLNRCCYTLINPWYSEPRNHWAIPALVDVLDERPGAAGGSPEVQQIQALIQDFVTSDQYAALNRLRQIFTPPTDNTDGADPLTAVSEQPLAHRIRYYPFLYDTSLLTKDSGQEQKKNITHLRRRTETSLGIELARFHNAHQGSSKVIETRNPTLLDGVDLNQALTYYTGKIDGLRSHSDQAKWFQTYSKTARSFRDFKDEFVDYLINPIAAMEPKYNGNHFTRNLRQYMRETLSEFDDQQLNSFILVETCRRVLNFLVVDSPQRPVFRNFRHLLNDIGYTLTMGLLLRVVLFCGKAKPWLERCLSVLFNLHERRYCKEVPWLVNSLEHANIALVTNFGSVGYQF